MVFLIGTDVGTTGCKTEIIDEDGKSIAMAYEEYPMLYPQPYWVETDPEGGWWKAYVDTTREVVKRSEIDPGDIAGISISCTNALVAVDKEGNALLNAIMQLDKRTVPQAEWIRENIGAEEIAEITGNRVAPGATSAPIILWIKENEPRIFRKTHKFLWPTGFVVAKLTGEFTMDWSRASWTCFFETKTRKIYSDKLCDEMGIPMEKLPPTYPSWEVVGEVTTEVAKTTGLAKGTPVVAGMADTPASAIGAGSVRPNDFLYVLGTVGRPVFTLGKPELDPMFINCCNAVPHTWQSLAALDGGSVCLRWFRDLFGQVEVNISEEIGESPYRLLDIEAERSPIGARGLIFFPYITGGRANVVWNPNARAVFFGLSLANRRGDIVRAILEGVTYALRHNYEKMKECYQLQSVSEMRMCGGGSKSALWRQITADMINLPVRPVKRIDTESLGNAILAGYGVGVFNDIKDATDRIVGTLDAHHPRVEYYEVYNHLFELYKELYEHIKEDFLTLRKISEKFSDLWR